MKRISTLFLSIFFLLLASAAQAQDTNRYLVMLKGKNKFSNLESDVQNLGGEIAYSHKIGFAVVDGLTEDAAAQLSSSKYIQDFAMNGSFDLEPNAADTLTSSMDTEIASPGDPTTAFFYPRQWDYPAISADLGWAAGRLGSSDVTVAILDTGIDYNYPDLQGRVDLSRSISFSPDDDFFVSLFFPGLHPVTDIHYHGTHVASTVASNSDVIAGMTTQTTLMGVKVCSAVTGGCAFDAVIAGVLHAADNGADVANMSLGGAFTKAGNGRFVGFINKVFNYANSMGMTIVVSAGNAAADLDHDGNSYKSYCSTPNTICVSATGPTSSDDLRAGPWYEVDAPTGYTNFGRSAINVAAPGGTGAGPVWQACSGTSLVIPVCQTGTFIVGLTGTSMSAPHVSGLAALLVEDLGRNPGAIREALQDGADDLGQEGTDPYYGKGRINVANTVLP